MLENGEFRQSISSTERALGFAKNSRIITRLLTSKDGTELNQSLAANPLPLKGSDDAEAQNSHPETSVLLPVRCPGVMHHTSIAYTINLPMVVEVWKHVALSGSKHSRTALELLGLSAVHSLERTYQEAFGVNDSRSTNDRLLDWAIRLGTGKHFPMFGGQFHKHFARVTGVTFGHPYAALCLGELVYQRLPKPVYEALKDINSCR